jgi:hypothetical protein
MNVSLFQGYYWKAVWSGESLFVSLLMTTTANDRMYIEEQKRQYIDLMT